MLPMVSYSDTASVSTAEDEKVKTSGRGRLERVLLPRRLCFLDQKPTREIDADNGEVFFEYHSTNVKQVRPISAHNLIRVMLTSTVDERE